MNQAHHEQAQALLFTMVQTDLWFVLPQDVSLYAETVDGIVGVARSVDGSKYQVRDWEKQKPYCVICLSLSHKTSLASPLLLSVTSIVHSVKSPISLSYHNHRIALASQYFLSVTSIVYSTISQSVTITKQLYYLLFSVTMDYSNIFVCLHQSSLASTSHCPLAFNFIPHHSITKHLLCQSH